MSERELSESDAKLLGLALERLPFETFVDLGEGEVTANVAGMPITFTSPDQVDEALSEIRTVNVSQDDDDLADELLELLGSIAGS